MKQHIPMIVLTAIVLFSLTASIVLAQENKPDGVQEASLAGSQVSLVHPIYPPPGLTNFCGCG